VYPHFEQELLLLLREPGLRAAMGEAGRRYVAREYAWTRVEERFSACLEM
jgi:hypothetical protein